VIVPLTLMVSLKSLIVPLRLIVPSRLIISLKTNVSLYSFGHVLVSSQILHLFIDKDDDNQRNSTPNFSTKSFRTSC